MADTPQCTFSFPGISNVIGGSMVYTRGITPGVCILHTIPKPQIISEIGDLVIRYGNQEIRFKNCAVNTHNLRREKGRDGKWVWALQILDRRWAWKNRSINGEFNIRMPDNKVRYSEIHLEQRKSLRELATMCLYAMGESLFDVSALPNDVYPYVNWKQANPASELQMLCDLVACVIVMDWRNNGVKIWQLGVGDPLPELPTVDDPQMLVAISRRPDYLALECWPTRFQLKFLLEAVGLDSDGTIQKIDNLSYKPDTGWSYEWYCAFPNVSAEYRHLAFQTVFRWYRVKSLSQGGLQIPGIGEPILSVDQFHLEDGLVETAADFEGLPQTLPSTCEGLFYPQSEWAATTLITARYNGPWKILKQYPNIIEFPYPVVRISGGLYVEPELYFLARTLVRRANGAGFLHEEIRRNLPWASVGAGGRILKHPELWATVVQKYQNVTYPAGISTNRDALLAEANRYLDYVASSYQAGSQEDRAYVDILPLSLDGAIAQVRWTMNIPSKTFASRNIESDAYTPSYEWRRRYEMVDTLADRDVGELP